MAIPALRHEPPALSLLAVLHCSRGMPGILSVPFVPREENTT